MNGGDFALFEGDLRLLGASFDRINPAGLRFVVSLGYETLAFHRDYVAANSWITAVPWLEPIDVASEWQIFRARPETPRLPARAFEDVLAEGRTDPRPRKAPAGCWITGSWPVTNDVIVTDTDWALLGWTDHDGRSIGPLVPALFQRVFGPSIPAFVVRAPDRPGSYRLTVFDRARQARAGFAYCIIAKLTVSQSDYPARRPGVTSHPIVVEPALASSGRSSLELTLANTSPYYVQASVFREQLTGTARSHPGLRSRWKKAGFGALVLRFTPLAGDSAEPGDGREIPLPYDLPPGGRLSVTIPLDRLPATWCDRPVRVEPSFTGIGRADAPPHAAEIKLAVEGAEPRAEIASPTTNRQPNRQ